MPEEDLERKELRELKVVKDRDVFRKIEDLLVMRRMDGLHILIDLLKPLGERLPVLAQGNAVKKDAIPAQVEERVNRYSVMMTYLPEFIHGEFLFTPDASIGAVVTYLQQFRNFMDERQIRWKPLFYGSEEGDLG